LGGVRVVSYLSEVGAGMHVGVFGGVVVPEVIDGKQYYSVYREKETK
jgi:hypothetical protein